METKRKDVQMSELTSKQQWEINAVDGISIAKAREVILAEGVARLHRKMFKPADINKTMLSTKNE